MPDSIEEIKSKLEIVEIIREHLQLTLAGANYKARCPFHQEKSASLMVSPSKQIWHCFGCNEGGDIFSFVMKLEGVEFGEALKMLAERAGVKLERQDPRVQGEKQRLLNLLDLASQYFQQAFLRSPKAESARAYVAARGLNQEMIDEFRIGYALPDFEALTAFLISRKYNAKEIEQVGLGLKKEQGYGFYDRFRNRLMIPIRNIHGAVIGFGGRVLDEKDKGAKYINSPQTVLYDKGRTVFGLDKARHEIRTRDSVVLVEGYMDFFAVYQSGMKNVVATSGTALTIDQVRLIKRFTHQFIFSFDTDTAGSKATMRGIELALSEGVNVRIVQLPRGADGKALYKDPDECVQKNPTVWQDAVGAAVSFVEWCFSQVITERALTDSYEKKNATRRLLDIIGLVPDRIEKDHWIKRLANDLSLSERILWEELEKKGATLPPRKEATQTSAQSGGSTSEDLLISLLMKYPRHIEKARDLLSPTMLKDAPSAELYRNMQEIYTHYIGRDSLDGFSDEFNKIAPAQAVNRMVFLADKEFGELDEKSIGELVTALCKNIKDAYIKGRVSTLQTLMRSAEERGDTTAVEQYAQEFHSLKDSLLSL